MPLKVIGAGYPRTGTMSLKLALEQLGFGPCHHMSEVILHPEQAAVWERALDEEAIDWEEVLAGYSSTTDAPSCFFYKELAQRYPDAKVILSIRSAESWWDSLQALVASGPPPTHIAPLVLKTLEYHSKHSDAVADPNSGSREDSIAAFNRYNEEVRRSIAPERLLTFEVKQGWRPLCDFLGVPAPSTPFPRVNASEDIHDPGKLSIGRVESLRSRSSSAT